MGVWVDNDARWFEMRMIYCDLCGRVIASRVWQAAIDGVQRRFCDADCERLYRTYLLKQEGPSAPAR
jgi:ribosome-binding protein aMBF1 (putative translation factor)